MAILPPAVVLTLLLDGKRLPSYVPLYLSQGRVIGPINPFVLRVAERLDYIGGYMIVTRGDRRFRIALARREPGQLAQTYVALGPVLRGLGERVEFDRARRLVIVRSPRPVGIRSPAPFDSRAPQTSPTTVFTPEPVPTPRPLWTGSPRPRRTPIPARSWATAPPRRGVK